MARRSSCCVRSSARTGPQAVDSQENVFVGEDAASATIPHSFFVESDADGNLLSAIPKIRRRY